MSVRRPRAYHVVREPTLVREVLFRVEEFSPANALTAVTPLSPAALRVLGNARFALPPVLASAVGEQHARTRAVVARQLRPRRVQAMAPRVAAVTEQRCREASVALRSGPVDLAREVTRHIPAAIMGELFNITPPPIDQLQRWSRESLELFWGWPDAIRQCELAASAAEFFAWLQEQVARPRRDSLFEALREAGIGRPQICSLGYFLGDRGSGNHCRADQCHAAPSPA